MAFHEGQACREHSALSPPTTSASGNTRNPTGMSQNVTTFAHHPMEPSEEETEAQRG